MWVRCRVLDMDAVGLPTPSPGTALTRVRAVAGGDLSSRVLGSVGGGTQEAQLRASSCGRRRGTHRIVTAAAWCCPIEPAARYRPERPRFDHALDERAAGRSAPGPPRCKGEGAARSWRFSERRHLHDVAQLPDPGPHQLDQARRQRRLSRPSPHPASGSSSRRASSIPTITPRRSRTGQQRTGLLTHRSLASP